MRFLALSFFIIAQSIALGGNVVLGNIGTLSWAGSAPNYIAQFAQPVGNIASIATAATANPATTSLQLSGGQNAVRVWTAQAANPAETNFTLNVLNSAAAYPVLLNNWQGRIINCIPGSSVAFGTVDGRTLRMAAMTVPASLAVFADYCVTGIANCDRAGPLIWEPSTKVTLSANNLSIKFFPTNVEEIVFVSENDGVQWSPPIWFRLTTNQPVFYQCTNGVLVDKS